MRFKSDHCIYYKSNDDYFLVIVLYVDGMFIGKGKGLIVELKSHLSKKLEMKDLGATRHILGMEIIRDRKNRNLWLGQSKYVDTILKRFNMQDSRPLSVPLTMGTKISRS